MNEMKWNVVDERSNRRVLFTLYITILTVSLDISRQGCHEQLLSVHLWANCPHPAHDEWWVTGIPHHLGNSSLLFLSSSEQGLQILLMSEVSVTSASQTLESFWNNYLESSITTKKAIFTLSSTWSWHVYTIVRDTWNSCGGLLTWKAQIHDGGHQVNFDRNLPSSCFVAQYNS